MVWPRFCEVLPPLSSATDAGERADVARACAEAARLVAAHMDSGQSYEAAKGYGGGEWHNALLRAPVGRDGAYQLLTAPPSTA